ncbi:hypothetical protein HPB50_005376 [Hyalomma asiaticum]|uniref:Uncharacterized protein n=1 Tax=Hyalomma asiaticum TaxID=266040 RepID=A0ACB7RJM7_HYAAI|nr:hypothetical protein HPB50_005376 [Hyalomma asiaticum]
MFSRGMSPSGDDYYGFYQSQRGVVGFARSDRLLIATPPRRRDANNHDILFYSCSVMFLVSLVVCMVLLTAQGRLQGGLHVQDVDLAAGSSPSGGNHRQNGALKSEAHPREGSHRQARKVSTHTWRLHSTHTANLHRPTTADVLPDPLEAERGSPSSPRRDLSVGSGENPRVTAMISDEIEKGGSATPPTPSTASSGESGTDKFDIGTVYHAEATSTLSTEENRGATSESVVRLHPLPIDTPPGDDDVDYDDGQRVGSGDGDRRR